MNDFELSKADINDYENKISQVNIIEFEKIMLASLVLKRVLDRDGDVDQFINETYVANSRETSNPHDYIRGLMLCSLDPVAIKGVFEAYPQDMAKVMAEIEGMAGYNKEGKLQLIQCHDYDYRNMPEDFIASILITHAFEKVFGSVSVHGKSMEVRLSYSKPSIDKVMKMDEPKRSMYLKSLCAMIATGQTAVLMGEISKKDVAMIFTSSKSFKNFLSFIISEAVDIIKSEGAPQSMIESFADEALDQDEKLYSPLSSGRYIDVSMAICGSVLKMINGKKEIN